LKKKIVKTEIRPSLLLWAIDYSLK